MRIGFLIPNLGVRGSVRRVVELSNHLIQFGHEVRVYTADGQDCNWLPLEAEVLPEPAVLKIWHDALIYFTSPLHLGYVCAAKTLARFLYILGIDDPNEEEVRRVVKSDLVADPFTDSLRAALGMPLIRLIANCSALASWVEATFGKPCACVPGGVNFDVFHPRNIPRMPHLILAGGAKRAIEGTAEALEIGERIKAVVPDARLEFYAYRGYSQEELARLYASASVFLDPQRFGGWNNPVAEAMAVKTPVVCTDIHGVRDFAFHKRTAWVAPAVDVNEMLRGVHRLLVDAEFASRLAEAAYQKIQPFTWEAAARKLEAVIREAVDG